MLSHISIKNFAIIREMDLSFHPGLNVLTGETGAGKSIIIQAIHMALGGRADSSMVRTGTDKASIRLSIEWGDPQVAAFLEEAGMEPESPLLLSREILASGKSSSRINGQPVPLSLLSRLCKLLADIHGQYEHQSLLLPENQLYLADAFGGAPCSSAKEAVAEAFARQKAIESELKNIRAAMSRSLQQQDFARYQLEEIRRADLRPGEENELRQELTLLVHGEKIHDHLDESYRLLCGPEGLSSLEKAMSLLDSIRDLSPELAALAGDMADCYYRLEEDLGPRLRKQRDAMDFSRERLDDVSGRLSQIETIKRKYGGSEEEILALAQKLEGDLRLLEDGEFQTKELEEALVRATGELTAASANLTDLRRESAGRLCGAVEEELRQLNFPNARLVPAFTPCGFTENGAEQLELLFSANKGEDPKPLGKIASGGELSRIMLAFKTVLGETDRIPCLIFDEIDSGISGNAAAVVGRKLKELAKEHQILCITHLPQIAACGAHHYRIEKRAVGESTATSVYPLDEEERVIEIARLLGGLKIGPAALDNARELLAHFA